MRTVAAKCVLCLGAVVAILLATRVLTEPVAVACLTAAAAATGWLCGVRGGFIVVAIGAALEPLLHRAALEPAPFVLRWGIAAALMFAASRAREQFECERRKARIDSLTGLANRTQFLERATAELNRARRSLRPLTLMLLDGDQFKAVNDRHGHAAGDRALKQTAAALIQSVRPYDLVSRLGGDEFVILLPETVPADAERIAARLQESLAARLAEFAPLTYCMGVVTVIRVTQEIADYLNQADQALYAAKKEGPSRCKFVVVPAEEAPETNGAERA
jgi:diguanylate cyclase (GGDEF)-like protein